MYRIMAGKDDVARGSLLPIDTPDAFLADMPRGEHAAGALLQLLRDYMAAFGEQDGLDARTYTVHELARDLEAGLDPTNVPPSLGILS